MVMTNPAVMAKRYHKFFLPYRYQNGNDHKYRYGDFLLKTTPANGSRPEIDWGEEWKKFPLLGKSPPKKS